MVKTIQCKLSYPLRSVRIEGISHRISKIGRASQQHEASLSVKGKQRTLIINI